MLSDQELSRYSRQLLLPDIDIAGQLALKASKVMIVGAGGLGTIAAMLLAGCGVGQLTLVDMDRIELSNLSRQIAYTPADVGRYKVTALSTALEARNPNMKIHRLRCAFSEGALDADLLQQHLVLDCTDNFRTRYEINQACLQARVPLVVGAAIGLKGQLAVFDFLHMTSPCYHCLFPGLEHEIDQCSESGVLPSVPNVIGALQATEAVKLLLPERDKCLPYLLSWEAKQMNFRTALIQSDPECGVCGLPAANL